MLLRDEQLLHLQDVQMLLEDPDRQLVGNHPPLRGVLFDLAAEPPVLGDLAEDVTHGDVDPVGKLPEHGPLGSLAATGHSEQEDGAIPVMVVHGSIFPEGGRG